MFGAAGARMGRAGTLLPYAAVIRSSVTSRRMLLARFCRRQIGGGPLRGLCLSRRDPLLPIRPSVGTDGPALRAHRTRPHFGKQDFVYKPEENVYRCPASEALKYHYTKEEKG